MDVDGLLQGVIRFSNFMTSRLLVSGVVFYVFAGFMAIGNSTVGLLPDLDLVNQVVQNYQTIFDVLGVSEFALLLILFIFLTTIHIIYVVFERLGGYLPPAIVPLPGWTAVDDVTHSAFEILREARGEEHTEEENQRLYEFRKKLGEIEATIEEKYRGELASINAAFEISKALVVFSALAWLYAAISGGYSGDRTYLLLILVISVLTAIYTAFSIFRANLERITHLREDIIVQFLGFSRIWLPERFQERIAKACTPSRDLRAAKFAVVVPGYGTLDILIDDLRRWRHRRQTGSL